MIRSDIGYRLYRIGISYRQCKYR